MPRPSPLLLLGSTPRAQQAPSSLNRSPTTTPQTKTQNPEPKIHAKKLKIENRKSHFRTPTPTPNSELTQIPWQILDQNSAHFPSPFVSRNQSSGIRIRNKQKKGMEFDRKRARGAPPERCTPENRQKIREKVQSREEWRAADARFAVSHAAVLERGVLLGEGWLRRCGQGAVLI